MQRMVVAIMAKAPRAGEVKTRLCPPLSTNEAAELYRCLLLDKIEQVRTVTKAIPAIAFTPDEGRTFFEEVAPGFLLLPQRGGDLGVRLAHNFDQLLAKGYTGALAIDTDTPTLPTHFLELALDLIATPAIDLVLGPSEDGGYYLIGLRKLYRELFEEIAWSTAEVMPETIRRAEAKGLKVATLPVWFDVDTPDDLERLKASLKSAAESTARHTRRFMKERAA
ncbi:MAG: TIGR04282 family arsenosugar biosynthesis glycosyltransferase [Candidatus Methylomirabilales bacterium]